MVKQLLKAIDAGFTAFCNELWLPTFGFHLFDDPADALEDDVRPCHMCDETCGVCRDAVLDERAKRVVDVPVELAGSLSAPGDGPEVGDSPRSAPTSGQPTSYSRDCNCEDMSDAYLWSPLHHPDCISHLDVIPIGPECFASKDGSVLCWQGVNYVPQK